jgi:hypothetical protein
VPQLLNPPIYGASRDGLIAKYSPSFSGDLQLILPIEGSFQGDPVIAHSLLVDNFNGASSINYTIGGEIGYVPPYTAETVDVSHASTVILTSTDSYVVNLTLYNRPVNISRTRGLTPSGIYDSMWSNVVGLWHFDGANNATQATDSKNAGLYISNGSSPILSTAKPQFGSASAFNPGTAKISASETVNLNHIGTNVTLEAASFPVTAFAAGSANCPDGMNHICGITDNVSANYFLAYQTNGANIRFVVLKALFSGGGNTVVCATNYSYSLNPATYYSLAMTTQNGVVSLFVNGTLAGTANFQVGDFVPFMVLFPNNDLYFNSSFWSGQQYVDELRLTIGNRYPQNYTPSGQAFPNQ